MVVSEILDTNMTFVGPKRRKTPIPHDLYQEPLNAPSLKKGLCFPGDFQEGKRPIKALGKTAH